ncbi:MAG: ribonuclease PH [Acidobacteriota bacterium]
MARADGRGANELRTIRIEPGFFPSAEGSALVSFGKTRVACAVSVEDKVPPFLKGKGQGWITAEYGMLPRSTSTRTSREGTRGPSGRTHEIQRLIGRSLRAVTNLQALGERTLWIDCDVLGADGGTRTASITGAFVALVLAMEHLRKRNLFEKIPVSDHVAAVSVGLLASEALLDLCYDEDLKARVDMNVVMSGKGRFIEVQGTGEESTFERAELDRMLELAATGIGRIVEIQKTTLGGVFRP